MCCPFPAEQISQVVLVFQRRPEAQPVLAEVCRQDQAVAAVEEIAATNSSISSSEDTGSSPPAKTSTGIAVVIKRKTARFSSTGLS